MTRVALVSQHHDLAWDTPARFVDGDETRRGLSRALTARGWDVSVVVEAEFDADHVDGSVRWRFRAPSGVARAARALGRALGDPHPAIRSPAPHLVRAVAEGAPDLVHSFDLVYYPLLRALAGLGRPLVAHFHGGAAARRPAWRQLERLALSRVDRLLFTTQSHADPWVRNGYPADHVRLVTETSVDLAPAGPGAPAPGATRAGAPMLACVGRLDAVKDPLTTLAGFALVLRDAPGAVLHLAWTDAPLRAAVLHAARPLGAHVRLHERLSRTGARALIGDADVLVQGSTREVCGIAVLEAMAAGTPPVVTDIPSFRAVLGDCGARFPPGDPAGLAAGVHAVLADPTQRARCRARFERELSFDALAERVEGVYRELL